jgi:hypothetical protein
LNNNSFSWFKLFSFSISWWCSVDKLLIVEFNLSMWRFLFFILSFNSVYFEFKFSYYVFLSFYSIMSWSLVCNFWLNIEIFCFRSSISFCISMFRFYSLQFNLSINSLFSFPIFSFSWMIELIIFFFLNNSDLFIFNSSKFVLFSNLSLSIIFSFNYKTKQIWMN